MSVNAAAEARIARTFEALQSHCLEGFRSDSVRNGLIPCRNVKVDVIVKTHLFDVGENHTDPRKISSIESGSDVTATTTEVLFEAPIITLRQHLIGIVIVVQREPYLLQVIFALCSASSLTCLLHSWQQQCNQNRNNSNDHQQLNKRETKTSSLFSDHVKTPRKTSKTSKQ